MIPKDRAGNSNPNDDRDIVDIVSAWYGEAQPAPESRHQAIEQIVHSAGSARARTGDAIRWVKWPALAAAAALVLWLGFASSQRDGPRGGLAGISFEFRVSEPEAQQVTLAGDFNGWNPRSTPMQRDRQTGLWRVS